MRTARPSRNETVYIVVGGMLSAVAAYFFFSPLFVRGLASLRPHSFQSLQHAQQYYSILSSFVTAIIGVLGLTLGYFYFCEKQEADYAQQDFNWLTKNVELILSELNRFDILVTDIFVLDFRDQKDLDAKRERIARSFEGVEIMLEKYDARLKFSAVEIKQILALNSFVDKCDLLRNAQASALRRPELLAIRDMYIDKLQAARRVCYERLAKERTQKPAD